MGKNDLLGSFSLSSLMQRGKKNVSLKSEAEMTEAAVVGSKQLGE